MSEPAPESGGQNQPERTRIERILIALDASDTSLAALRAATELAATLEAELLGLFVEDINLVRLANLPFASEIGFSSAAARRLSDQHMSQTLRIQAARARRALRTATEQAQIRSSFRVVQGQVPLEILSAALDVDLLILGRVSRPPVGRTRLGSTARAAVLESQRPVLLARGSLRQDRAVLVVYDGSPLSRQALHIAAEVAAPQAPLTVVLLAATPEEAEQLAAEADHWLVPLPVDVRYRQLRYANTIDLAHLTAEIGCGLLVLSGNHEQLSEAVVQELLGRTGCSVLIIRPPR